MKLIVLLSMTCFIFGFAKGLIHEIDTPNAGCFSSGNTNNVYVYYTPLITRGIYPSTEQSITFQVKACNDAFMLLSSAPYLKSAEFYELVFGGGANTKIFLRRKSGRGNTMATKYCKSCLNCNEYTTFTVKWSDGTIVIMRESEIYIKWTDPKPLSINGIGIATGCGSVGSWKIEERKETETVGTTYTQWGRSTCTQKDAELVYSGYVGGTDWLIKGAAVNKLCLPKQPQWGISDYKVNNNPSIGGTIFHLFDINVANTLFDQKYTYYRMECAVCHIKHATSTIMIPGRKECFNGWTMAYSGYLFAGHNTHPAASEYLCMDGKPDHSVKTSSKWGHKALMYPVQASCNDAIPCPPYINGREMTCVVCAK